MKKNSVNKEPKKVVFIQDENSKSDVSSNIQLQTNVTGNFLNNEGTDENYDTNEDKGKLDL